MCGDRRPAWNRTADMWETGLGVSPEVRTEKGGILPQAGGSLRLQQTPQKGFVRMEMRSRSGRCIFSWTSLRLAAGGPGSVSSCSWEGLFRPHKKLCELGQLTSPCWVAAFPS